MNYTTLLFDVRDHIARITLNRPEAANALNEEMGRDLMQAILHCDEDPSIRAVVLTAKGSVFCGGGDLKSFTAQGQHLSYFLKEMTTYFHGAISLLIRMSPPVIAAVNGFAAGAGMSLVLASDIVVAGQSARFNAAYTRVGLTPDGSLSYFLPRCVGLKRALELTLTNRIFSAQEALDWGMVNRVVPDGELLEQANAIATQIAAGPPKALGGAKRLLHMSWNETLETQMAHESQMIASMGKTADTFEGITAFLEKRVPKFKGE